MDISCQGQEELISSNLSLRLESLKECGGWTVDPNHAAICSVGYGNDDDDNNDDDLSYEMFIIESMGFESSSQIQLDYECFEQEIIGQVCSEAVLVRVEGAEYADCDGWYS